MVQAIFEFSGFCFFGCAKTATGLNMSGFCLFYLICFFDHIFFPGSEYWVKQI